VYLFGDGLDDGSGGLYGWARYRHGLLDESVRHRDGATQEFRRDIQALYDGLTSPVQCFLNEKHNFLKTPRPFMFLKGNGFILKIIVNLFKNYSRIWV
jgi:hypothetical protein